MESRHSHSHSEHGTRHHGGHGDHGSSEWRHRRHREKRRRRRQGMILALCLLAVIAASLVLMAKGCQNDSTPSASLHPGT